jgi:hypothetical protein
MNNQLNFKFAAICGIAAAFMTQPVMAMNNRSWVSRMGSDANSCDIASPCRTYQHAHDMTAEGGEVNTLDPADYGKLTISHSITLDGANMGYIQLTPSPQFENAAIRVDSSPTARNRPNVIIRNLSIAGIPSSPTTGTGILWAYGGLLMLESVSINGVITGINTQLPLGATDATRPQMFVTNTTIRNCSKYGMLIGGAVVNGTQQATDLTAVVDRSYIENVAYGVSLATGSVNITRTLISRASVSAVEGASNLGPCDINLEDSHVTYSKAAVTTWGATIRLAGNNIHNNDAAFVSNGGAIVSFGNNRVIANKAGETLVGAPVPMM